MAANTCRQYLLQVIGLTTDAQADAVRDQGLTTLDEFASFDEEGIKILCTSIRKHGGLITDPNAPDACGRGRGANPPPPMIANPGFKIPAICESRMKDAAFAAKNYSMIGRAITRDSLSAARIQEYKILRDLLKNHKDPDKLPVVSKTYTVTKALDALPGYLREKIGCRGVALSYIIRQDPTLPVIPAQVAESVTTWAMSQALTILTSGFAKLSKMTALNTTSMCCCTSTTR